MGPGVDRSDVRLRPAPGRIALAAVPTAFLALFFIYPLASILGSVIGEVSPGTVLGDARLRGVIWFTTWQAVVSTALTLALGLPAAHLLARFRFPGRSALRVATLVAFVLPTVVVGTAFAGSRPSLAALFAAHVFFNLAVVVRVVGGFWSQLDPAYEDLAAEMGATGVRRFTDVLLPLARPAIVGAATLVFLFTFTSFGVALLLCGEDVVSLSGCTLIVCSPNRANASSFASETGNEAVIPGRSGLSLDKFPCYLRQTAQSSSAGKTSSDGYSAS